MKRFNTSSGSRIVSANKVKLNKCYLNSVTPFFFSKLLLSVADIVTRRGRKEKGGKWGGGGGRSERG